MENTAISRANRGRVLEELIEWANNQYDARKIATVQKIPTPIAINHNGMRGSRIIDAYFKKKSTLDFIGVMKNGIAIAFVAKETNELYLPLKNLEDHQYDFMTRWHNYGGRSFLIVSFLKMDKIYRLDYEIIKDYWDAWKQNQGKRGYARITLSTFEQHGKELKSKDGIALDYLEGLY